jgi:hypothetical protein
MTEQETGRGTTPTPFDLDELLGPTPKKVSREESYRKASEQEDMVREFLCEQGVTSYALTPGSGHPFVIRNGEPCSLGFQSHQLDIGIGCYRGEIKARSLPLFKKPSDYKYKTVFLDDLDGISKKVAPIDFYIILSDQTTIEDLRKGHGALVVPVKHHEYYGYLKQETKWIAGDGVNKTNLSCPREHCLDIKSSVEDWKVLQDRRYEEKRERDSRFEVPPSK